MYYDVNNFIWLVNDVSIYVWSVGLYVRAQSLHFFLLSPVKHGENCQGAGVELFV